MKKQALLISAIILFLIGAYTSVLNGTSDLFSNADTTIELSSSPVIYTGIRASVALFFSNIILFLINVFNQNAFLAIIALGVLTEVILLYPAIRIQLKQKKIHLFHKKLVDRFNSGELSVSRTKAELHKIYDVNEKIHRRGAIYVSAQLIIFLFTFWGLSLVSRAPNLIQSIWNLDNLKLFSVSENIWLPVITALIYFFHSMVKMHYKQKEDYIGQAQIITALLISIISTVVIFFFAQIFSAALSLYFVTLVSFSTARYIIVESHHKKWMPQVKKELLKMLKEAKSHRNRFEYLSRAWNHLPIIRHINFSLLEEALSMTLGLLLALTFFGSFDGSHPTDQSMPFEASILDINADQ